MRQHTSALQAQESLLPAASQVPTMCFLCRWLASSRVLLCLSQHLLCLQDQLNKAQESIEAQRKDAQKQIEAASRDRDNAVDALNTAQRQLNDVNNRLLELAGSGPGQAHPVTGRRSR